MGRQLFLILSVLTPDVKAVTCDHDVVGLQIAVHDPGGVSLCKAFGDVLQMSQQLFEIRLLAMNFLAQRDAVDEFHCDEMCAIAFANLVNVRNVRVIERGGGSRLLLEAPHSILTGCELTRENLQRSFAMEARVFAEMHLTHSAFAYLRADFVAAQVYARGNSHRFNSTA